MNPTMEIPLAPHHLAHMATTPSANALTSFRPAARTSPILEFLFFHKAIRAELELLRRDAVAVEKGSEKEFQALSDRYQFLQLVYVQHSNAEDEVIFPALDSRVKNVAQTYSLEHKEESELFDQMWDLLNSALKDKGNASIKLRRELICCTEAIQTSLCQHMSKEEEQVFPLLMQHFSFEEQAALVWQFMCSIPINLMEKFLPWLASSLSQDECQEMIACMYKVVPREELLRQVIFAWLKGGNATARLESSRSDLKEVSRFTDKTVTLKRVNNNGEREDLSTSQADGVVLEKVENRRSGFPCKRRNERSNKVASEFSTFENEGTNTSSKFPINELLHWHNAIRKELKEFAEEARKIQLSACLLPASLSSFSDRLHFLAEVCTFHSAAEDKVVFPAVGQKAKHGVSYASEHAQEEQQFDYVRRLLEGVHTIRDGSLAAAEIYDKLCVQADLIVETVQKHLLDEEIKVLPLAREHCSVEEQRKLLYQSLRVMPLKLLERVLPWLVALLNEDEAKSMLQNMRLAAPVADAALVTLFSGWACKGHVQNLERSGGFRCISSCAINDCSVKKKTSNSGCCCEAVSTDSLFGQEPVVSLAISEDRPCKRPRHGDMEPEAKGVCGVNQYENSVANQSCCVPGLGVTGSRRTFKALSFNPFSSGYLGSGLFGWGTDVSAGAGTVPKPIDSIFQFHKAIRKDLKYLDLESEKLADCDDDFLRQFDGRFRFLWGLYRAHSNAEDEIVFPALEAKEALHNVSHSYTIDHKQEERLFYDISVVLSELSHLHGRMHNQVSGPCQRQDTNGDCCTGSDTHQKDIIHKQELAAKLQGMCKSVRITLDQHISREELELWPLFDAHFTIEEQDKIVGRIIGTTGAEVLQAMLPWVTTALTQEEQSVMMDTWRQATRNTMFDKWLRAWWKGSPTGSPHSLTLGNEGAFPRGTTECLQMVADYLSKGVSNNVDPDNKNTSRSNDSNFTDRTYIVHGIPDTKGSDFQKMKEKEIYKSEASKLDQVQTSSEKQNSPPEENCCKDQVEDCIGEFKPGWQNIFRMNQNELEAAIRKVSSDTSLDPRQKAYLMQNLMTSRWIAAQQQPQAFVGQVVSSQDIPGRFPSFSNIEKGRYGCEHYKRNCKVRAACCGLLFACRFCHDKVSDHSMDRQATKEMMCMKCLEIQPVAQHCATASCNGFRMARYFCSICKLFDDDDDRDIYHCPFCNICRVGKGLGIDYFHCMTCNACMSKTLTAHRCREKGLESNCPICHDFLFTSNTPVKALACGHFMHSACFQAYTYSHYTCPICSKSLGDMAVYFGMLDALLAAEQLPDEYIDRQQDILCNDCGQKSTAPFHWLYHKCSKCGSYNTRAI